MAWVPQSLLSRSILLISALLVVSQLIWFGLYRTYNVRAQSEYLASQIASVISTVSTALETMPASARRKFSEKLPAHQNIRLLPATAWDDEEVSLPESPLLQSISERLSHDFSGDAQALVMLEDATHALWIKIKVKNQAYWVVFPAEARGSASAWAWTGWSVFGLTLALAGGFLLMVRVNRPLRALARAAGDIGAGKTPAPVDEKGPTEIRALSRAFNQMTSNLRQLDADRAVLLAGVSHDLRTPLSRLRLGVEMLEEGQDKGLRAGMIQDIEDIDAVINQFLDFARQGGNEPSRPGEDLNHIVSSVCERYARCGMAIRTRLGELPPLTLKPTATQRMVTNLVDNAVRHGGQDVEVRTERIGDRAVVSVLDRGPGIPDAEFARVMQPFTRLDTSRAGGKGSGLGLAIVERAARMHGGNVTLHGREGGGLEARVELPVASGTA
ncbi:MAG TPA: ATP-binding protein [Burkholderiales bacterium]|nr:ATP-binding protein [Burkholderiales bacterium]